MSTQRQPDTHTDHSFTDSGGGGRHRPVDLVECPSIHSLEGRADLPRRWIQAISLSFLVGGCAGGSDDDSGGDSGPTGVIDERTIVVDKVDDASVEADRLIFPRSTHPGLLDRKPGEFLVGDRAGGDFVTQKNPDGFIRKIVAVGATEDSIIIDSSSRSSGVARVATVARGTPQTIACTIDIGKADDMTRPLIEFVKSQHLGAKDVPAEELE